VGPAGRPQAKRRRKRPHRVGGNAQRPPLTTPGVGAPRPTRTAERRAAIDEHTWQREMNALRRIGPVLSAALAALVAHMVIDGPELVGDLTAALILLLLIFSLVLRRQGHRLRPGASSQPTGADRPTLNPCRLPESPGSGDARSLDRPGCLTVRVDEEPVPIGSEAGPQLRGRLSGVPRQPKEPA
jgi:hypothetical protein